MNHVCFPVKVISVISSWYITRTSSWERRAWSMGLSNELRRQATSFSARFLFAVGPHKQAWAMNVSCCHRRISINPSRASCYYGYNRSQLSLSLDCKIWRVPRTVFYAPSVWYLWEAWNGSHIILNKEGFLSLSAPVAASRSALVIIKDYEDPQLWTFVPFITRQGHCNFSAPTAVALIPVYE